MEVPETTLEKIPGSGPRRIGLVTQLAILVGLLSLGPLLCTNAIGYFRSRSDLKSWALQSLQSSARVAALQTGLFIEERRDLIPSLVAGNRYLRSSMAEAADSLRSTGTLSGTGHLHDHLAAKADQTQRVEEFYVLDGRGVVLGSSNAESEVGVTRFDDPCSGLRRHDGVATSMEYSERGPHFVVAAPIDGERGRRAGTFCARFQFDVHEELQELASSQTPKKKFLIVARDGHTVCGSFEEHHFGAPLPGAFVEKMGEPDTWSHPHELEAHEAPHGLISDAPHEHQLAAVVPIRNTDWNVVALLSEERALASLDELKQSVAWMGGGFLLLVVFGIAFTVRTTAGPLEDLVRATGKMKDGQLDQRVDARGPREIAELSEVFNAMSLEVSRLRDNLEDRVAARTAELESRTEDLRRSEAFSQLLFNSMDANLLVVDESCMIASANDAALRCFGEDLVGRRCHQVLEGSETPCPDCPAELAFDTGEPGVVDRVYMRGGRPEIMEVQTFPLPASEAHDARVLMLSRQVTERKSREAQMAHHEKMSAFALLAAGIGHEIGNPLASIKAQLRLAEELDDAEFTKDTLEVVDGEVDRISRLLRQIVHFSRRRQTGTTLVSWNQVIGDALQLLRHDPRSRQVEFITDLAEDLPPVRADEDCLLQVLLNLGINGVDAIDGRGTLTIHTFVEDDRACVSVSDTGPGIPREMRDRIFEPYFTTKGSDNGTGLGLFVSRRLIEELGGTVTCEEAADGATFVVRLPADADDEGRDATPNSEEEPA